MQQPLGKRRRQECIQYLFFVVAATYPRRPGRVTTPLEGGGGGANRCQTARRREARVFLPDERRWQSACGRSQTAAALRDPAASDRVSCRQDLRRAGPVQEHARAPWCRAHEDLHRPRGHAEVLATSPRAYLRRSADVFRGMSVLFKCGAVALCLHAGPAKSLPSAFITEPLCCRSVARQVPLAAQRSEIVSSVREQAKDQKRKKQTRERWLLTRKTWRYMADAGRRLIPEGAQNRVEDIPKLEAYFQEVCQKEKRFLLWRKSSYPGALNFRVHRKKQRERKKWSSCREKASSADEAEQQKRLFEVETKSGGRFDIQKLRQQFLDSGPPASQTGDEFAMRYKALKPIPDQTRYLPDVPEYSATQQEDVSLEDDERELMDTLLYLLSREQDGAPVETNEDERKALDYAKLFYQLKRYLSQSNSGDGQTASDSARDMYKTTTTDFEKESPGANSRSREYPVSEISTRSDISLKNRKGLHTDGYEENREAVTLRSTPRSTKDDNYQYGYERVNLRRNANSVSSSTDDTKDDTNLKSRGEFQSGSQPRSGFMYRLGKTNSDVHPRTTHNHSPVSGQQTSPGPSSRRIPRTGSGNVYFEGDHLRKLLIETLRRYYNKSDSRDKVISDILTDRKVLEKLYFDLRKARNFKGRSGPTDGQDTDRHNWKTSTDKMYEVRNEGGRYGHDESLNRGWKGSEKTMAKRPCDLPLYTKPPIIAVEQEAGARWASKTIQTLPVPEEVMAAIEEFSKREKEKALEEKEEKEDNELKPPPVVTRRRSSVDHDDVSPSVSDTIKRYLKMARKKSVDADKVDRFKRVNYDRNLRNIKPKGEISRPGDDDGLSKGCQTEETWVAALKELKQDDIGLLSEEDDYQRSRMTSCRSSFDSTTYDEALLSPPSPVHGKAHSPGLLSSGQSFLSHLLHGRHHHDVSQPGSPVAAGAAMQKSKSSSSVVHHGSRIVARKIWRTRSKSQSRAVPSVTSTWTPQVSRCRLFSALTLMC
ncbi:hypothetical protein PR048_024340 [Dryococelus australis]|uniref:Uncharacterized protein n=1 Tax=Dryococelus australis TaxID=614101 RepID=A0ABQ9GNB1_9NEOP|nr:hypothetical protein PR048_024340 [Dryococelus australis]